MKIIFFILLCIPSLLFSQTEKRLALVIGNANYDKGELKNPVNDALLMAKTLEKLDFDVILDTNIVSKRAFVNRVSEFGERRSNYNVGFVYYAGHGVQVNNENYLLPTKEDFNSEYDIQDYAVSVQKIMRYLTSNTSEVNILILDACRDNPFESNWNETARSLGGKGSGLAKMQAPTGSLIAFSTSAGNTASDGKGQNSYYAESLANNFVKVNTTIDQVFRNVREEVLEKTGGKQMTEEATQLTGGAFYLLLKKDYGKIEVKDLQEQAESEKAKGNIQNALDKYTILEIYLKSEMNNIDKKKLRQVYFDMGHIYYQMSDSEPTKFYEENKEEWTEEKYQEYLRINNKYLSNASTSFLNAKLLYENEGAITNNDKELYSEAFYKYLRCQSYLDYASGGIDDSTFIQEINKLNKYNQDNFGQLDFRVACSHYLTGLFIKDKNPLSSYENFIKSAEIFSASVNKKIEIEKLNKYALTFNHVFPYKWSIISFNDILQYSFGEDDYVSKDKAKEVNEYLRENINSSVDSIYAKNLNIINKGISISKSNNNSDLEGLYLTATKFFHTFPIVLDVSDQIYIECSHSTIQYRNLALSQIAYPTYIDSISTLNANAITYSNLQLIIDSTDIDSVRKVEKIIYDLYKEAFNLGVNHNDGTYSLWICNKLLSNYYLDHSEISLYQYKDIEDMLSLINSLYTSIIKEYGCEDEAPLLSQYFTKLDMLYEENLLLDNDIISKYKQQKDIYLMLFPEKE